VIRVLREREPVEKPVGGPLAGLSHFTDVVPVASGATSQVFRARQPAMARLVAIKVLTPTDDRAVRARFDRELATVGRLSWHPQVVTVLEYGISPAGVPYLVMPWYSRGSLADELGRRGPLPVAEVLRIGVRIGAALDHAHQHGVLHRDVKPANILLSEFDEPVLADFGGAARLQELSAVTSSYTPMYAAPELLCGKPACAGSDVWSMSSTLYAALTGRSPFLGDGSGGLAGALSRVISAPTPPMGRTDVPSELEGLLGAGLAKRPEDRPTASEFAVEAQRVQVTSGLPVTEIPASTSVPVPLAASDAVGVQAPRTVLVAGDEALVQQQGRPAVEESALEESATVLRAASDVRRRRWPARRIAAAAGSALAGAAVAAAVLQPLQSVATASRRTVPAEARTTAAPRSPAPANSLSVVGLSRTSITLHWVDTNGGASRYVVVVERASGSVAEQAASGTGSYTVGSLRPGTGYCLRVATVAGPARLVTDRVCARTLE
jgi:hypothetical protein